MFTMAANRQRVRRGSPDSAETPDRRSPLPCTKRACGKSRPNRRGYTLIELLTVVTVIGILASIVVPSMSNGTSTSLKAAGRILAADLRLASDLSMQYNTQYTVTFNVSTNQYQLTLSGSGNPPPLQNPQAPPGTAAGVYVVSVGQIDGTVTDSRGVRLLGAKLKTSGQSVTNISFGSLGGTGPSRTDDTEIWLIYGPNTNPIYLRLTVSALTGQVWMDQPTQYPSS